MVFGSDGRVFHKRAFHLFVWCMCACVYVLSVFVCLRWRGVSDTVFISCVWFLSSFLLCSSGGGVCDSVFHLFLCVLVVFLLFAALSGADFFGTTVFHLFLCMVFVFLSSSFFCFFAVLAFQVAEFPTQFFVFFLCVIFVFFFRLFALLSGGGVPDTDFHPFSCVVFVFFFFVLCCAFISGGRVCDTVFHHGQQV